MAEQSGRLAENILYFARALRAAGIPVGPGAVLDALAAVDAAGVGTREDFYWTLHAVFVKRHEHSLLFDQAFRIFFRKRAYLDQLLASMLPQAPMQSSRTRSRKPGAQRVQEALFSSARADRAAETRGRDRRAPHRLRPRAAAAQGLRADDRGRDRRRQGRDQATRAARSTRSRPGGWRRTATAISSTCAGRCARASRPAAR